MERDARLLALVSNLGDGLCTHDPFIPTFLRWMGFCLGGLLLFTHLNLDLILVGSTLIAFVIAAAAGCAALTVSESLCVYPEVPIFIFRVGCFLLIGYSIVAEPNWIRNVARVRVAVQQPGEAGELPSSYDSKFIATECRLIRSPTIMRELTDRLPAEAVPKWVGVRLGQSESLELHSQSTDAKAVAGSSLIDIT